MSPEKGKSRRADQLPPGRHGLDPEFVARSQRGRLLQGILEAVAASGYEESRVTDVIARAGVSRKTFYEHFTDKEECFLAAYDLEQSHLMHAAGQAFSAPGAGDWPAGVRAALRALLHHLAQRPAAARVCFVDVMGATRAARAKRDAAVQGFTYFVDAGRGHAEHEVPGRTALGVLGAANELIANELVHGSASGLEALAPDLVYLITLPFIGPERAFAERELTESTQGEALADRRQGRGAEIAGDGETGAGTG